MTPVLHLDEVTFRRDGKQIIDGISLTVGAGEHWALLGPNGAGKSTLLGFCASVAIEVTQSTGALGLLPCAYRVGDVDDVEVRQQLRLA